MLEYRHVIPPSLGTPAICFHATCTLRFCVTTPIETNLYLHSLEPKDSFETIKTMSLISKLKHVCKWCS